MAENITSLELNGIKYALGKSIYAELDLSLERFVELLGRDFYCPTLNSAPTSTTKTYQDTDESVNTFQIGQPCRWMESDGTYRLAVLVDMTSSSATWYKLPVKVSELTNDAGYLTSHQDISHLATKTELSKKQDTISDLSTIRANAEKGATALQSVPSEYVTETELSGKGYATTSDLSSGLSGKVDKDGSKVLSSNDFTNALKSKLEGLSNYDDTTISNAVNKLRTDFDTLVSGDTTTAIKTFNEVIAFLNGITDTQDLESIIASIEQQIAAKQDKISDLETIRQGAAKGATALQSFTETDPVFSASAAAGIKSSDITNWNSKTSNTGTITGIKMNGASKGTSGVVDLGTVITEHQDISGKLDVSTAASTYLGKTDKAASATTADSATKATQDASGNVITSTYATKTELEGKVSGDGTILNIVKVTALPSSPDANTLYVIIES